MIKGNDMVNKLRKLLDWLLLEDMTLSFQLLQVKGKGYNFIAFSIKKFLVNVLIKILREVLY